ncbi:PucR family transcriptional regulator [Kribbella sp. NPDC049227]|uniref:PucR family transcriptional regulator n=1 Tax=Kribbella sp. NPDC049227 TaxID=3364113 RepID=UPI003717A5E6
MTSELQRLVDALGHKIQRNVTVDDAWMRQLAFSSHEYGPVDRLRQQSIFQQHDVRPEVLAWTQAAGARTAVEPFRPPIDPRIGCTHQRLVVPIRWQGALVGYIWIVEGENELTAEELKTVSQTTETLAAALHRDQLAEEFSKSRIRDLAHELILAGDLAARRHAAADLVDADYFVASEPVCVVVVTLSADGRGLSENERDVLGGWLDRAGRRLSDRRHICLVRRNHGLLLLSDKDPMFGGTEKVALVRDLLASVLADLPDSDPYAGIGSVAGDLTDAHSSYETAQRAARVARVMGGPDRVMSHEELGVYGLLTRIPSRELDETCVPAGLLQLIGSGPKGAQLVDTLEAFLENAGDVQATAEQLFVHRTTLYYRLQRIEELTGAQLSNGEDRLVYHLGLKIARLIGLRS